MLSGVVPAGPKASCAYRPKVGRSARFLGSAPSVRVRVEVRRTACVVDTRAPGKALTCGRTEGRNVVSTNRLVETVEPLKGEPAMAVTKTAPTFKHDVTFCGEAVEGGRTCHRLTAHKGDHAAFARGNGVVAPKPRKVTKPKASKAVKAVGQLVTIGGTKFRAVIGKDGEVTLTRVVVEPKALPFVDMTFGGETVRVTAQLDGTFTTETLRVTEVAEAPSERRSIDKPKAARRAKAAPKGTQRKATEAVTA